VADGETVQVRTRRGTMRAPARVSATIRPDTVFVPFHWVGANRLTNDALDPASRMPEFKVCACSVSRPPDNWSQTADLEALNVSSVTSFAGATP
jgi:anaerobic selenocysteine-containing dehydrogenase